MVQRLTLALCSLLIGTVAFSAAGQLRSGHQEATEPVRTRPLDRLHADGFSPIPTSGGDLLDSDDPRIRRPLPGVTWEPGQPGSGGGSGGPLVAPEPTLESYTVERLPEGPNPGQGSQVTNIADSRDWASGSVGIFHDCHDTQAPALWKRDSSDIWQLHLLPSLDESAEGSASAVLNDGTAVGWDRVYSPDCLPGNGLIGVRPLLWEPAGEGVWSAVDLPTPEGTGATARAASHVYGAGLVIVGGRAWSETSSALLWRRVLGEWIVEDLGALGGGATAQAVDSSGVVVGYVDLAFPGAPDLRSFVLVPVDGDGDGAPDVWFRDDDGDGANDLMRLLGPTDVQGAAEKTGGSTAACGTTGGSAKYWKRTVGGSWDETALPGDGFPEGTSAWGMNRWLHVVGSGKLRRGEPLGRALLWQRDPAGGWSTLNLDEVSLKPADMTMEVAKAINTCGDVVAIVHEPEADAQLISDVVLRLTTSPCD